ncbi:MAG: Crp/Fnr family transcriptional regulator [Chloroflexota bacterium]
MELEDALRCLPLFAGMERKDLRDLARTMHLVRYSPGQEVLTEGKTAEFGDMGVVLSGCLRVVRANGEALGTIMPGEFFGEMAVVDNLPRSATVIATEPTEAATLKPWNLRSAIRASPEIAIHLLGTLSKRLREARETASEGPA